MDRISCRMFPALFFFFLVLYLLNYYFFFLCNYTLQASVNCSSIQKKKRFNIRLNYIRVYN